MQMYVSEHANKQHLFFFLFFFLRQQLGHFFQATAAVRKHSSSRAGHVGPGRGNREGSGTEGKGGKAPSPFAPT